MTVAIQDFPSGGGGRGEGVVNSKGGVPTYYFGQFFLITAWKWKKLELDRGEAGSSMSARQVDRVWGLEYNTYFIFVVITTEKTNILLRYLHQQWDKKVGKQSRHQINYNTTSFLKLNNLSDNSHCIKVNHYDEFKPCLHVTFFSLLFNNGPLLFSIVSMVMGWITNIMGDGPILSTIHWHNAK